MAKKRGNINVRLTVKDGVGTVHVRHTGIKGNRTLGRKSLDLADRAAFKQEMTRFIASTHPRMHSSTEAS